jgi:hypothetical protein
LLPNPSFGKSKKKLTMTWANDLRSREDNENNDSDRDTPSGVATPQPDPSDKRLPGIMHSYFGQVGAGSSTRPSSIPLESPALSDVENAASRHVGEERKDEEKAKEQEEKAVAVAEAAGVNVKGDTVQSPVTRDSSHEPLSDCCDRESSDPTEQTDLSVAPGISLSKLHPYPTPPVSQPPSLHKLKLGDASSEDDDEASPDQAPSSPSEGLIRSLSAQQEKNISELIPSGVRRPSVMNPLSSVVTPSNVHAAHFSNPSDCCKVNPASNAPSHPSDIHDSPSYDRLKKLTDDASRQKSIPATPTRALSNQTVKSDASGGSDPANAQPAKTTLEVTPPQSISTGASGPPAPAPKGKLIVKIAEARGLRRSRDPYVVAVFQRNELVSKGPIPQEGDDTDDVTSSPMMGGIPITRSGSDSGRPMAIPMKSRQSSNTSLSEYRDFKVKGRKSMTNPKWDTEAAL